MADARDNVSQVLEEMKAGDHRAADKLLPLVYDEFKRRVFEHRDELIETLNSIRAQGKRVHGYGASTKGNVILQFCELGPAEIECVAEVNSDKFGHYTPGTNIPIVSEADARAKNPDYFLVLPWHFAQNILQRESAYLKSGGRLIFPLPTIKVVSH